MVSAQIAEKIQKVHALAERGINGEKAAAERLLASLLTKHDVTLEQVGIFNAKRSWHTFSFQDKQQKAFLSHIIAAVVKRKYSAEINGKKFFAWMTEDEATNARLAYVKAKRYYNREVKSAKNRTANMIINSLYTKGEAQ